MIFPYACIFKKINLNADILVMPKEPEDVIISKLRQDMNGDNDNLYSDKKRETTLLKFLPSGNMLPVIK